MVDMLNTIQAESLILEAQAGDEKAFATIITEYMAVVKSKTSDLNVSGVERDDLIQEGLIGLMHAVSGFDPKREAGFSTYANRCIENQIKSAIRAAYRRKNAPLNNYIPIDAPRDENEPHYLLEQVGSSSLSVEEAVIGRERLDSILDIIYRRLSGFERQVLQLYIEGKSYHDIADTLQCTEKSVDNAIWRLKKKLSL